MTEVTVPALPKTPHQTETAAHGACVRPRLSTGLVQGWGCRLRVAQGEAWPTVTVTHSDSCHNSSWVTVP